MRPQLLLASLFLSACGGASPAPKVAPVAMVVVPEAKPEKKAEVDEPEPEPEAPPKREKAQLVDLLEEKSVLEDSLAEGAILSASSGFGAGPVGGLGGVFGGKLGAGGAGLGGGSGGGARAGAGIGPGGGGTASRPSARMGSLRVSGQLPESIVRRVLRSRLSPIHYCYRQELKTTPGLSGTTNVAFTISASGNVASVQISPLNSSLDACVKRVIQRVRFPSPKAGIVTVSYPLTFTKL